MTGAYENDSIFWIEVDRIRPNPFQPRKAFDESALNSLAESIRQYGVLQPLTVTRKEMERPDEGIFVEYELVAGERRLRASKIAGIAQVPAVIRTSEASDRMKLEIAIIENLQREDLNAIDRAKAFRRLAEEFGLSHREIGTRVGKSREYVSNTIRILLLPVHMQDALEKGDISDGHTRPLLMLIEKPREQDTLFKEVVARRLTVRDTEAMARRIAIERVRHKALLSPDLMSLEKQLGEILGTRVRIEKKDSGGKVMIDFFSPEDLTQLCLSLTSPRITQASQSASPASPAPGIEAMLAEMPSSSDEVQKPLQPTPAQPPENDSDLYSLSDFAV